MSSLLIMFFLALWHSFLFYNNVLGISVILFILPLLIFIIYYLKKKDLIKNKQGLLFIIPIILLSITYLIFNNDFFYCINILVISILFVLMFIFTIKPTFKPLELLNNFFEILLMPFNKFKNVLEDTKNSISKSLHISDKAKKIIKSFLLIIPIVIIVLLLLTSADMIFDSIVKDIIEIPKNLFRDFALDDFIGRLIRIFIVFLYLSATLYFLKDNYLESKPYIAKAKQRDKEPIIILLIVLNIIYVIFDIIQIKSLMLHSVSSDINYSSYTRQGFFQLMFVSLINIIIILLAKKHNDNKKIIIVLSLIMVFLTFIIIISAGFRMNLYEEAYGYTLLRLLVYITLFTEIILIIPLIIYIINNKFNIAKASVIIVITVYTFINFINIDSIIAKRNIDRYYLKHDIDIEYLENYGTDNINDLTNFFKEVKDKEIKYSLNNYFRDLNTSYNFQEFNLSKANAKKQIKKLKIY